jgi:lipopolysaccharide transport system ATP-binding protein
MSDTVISVEHLSKVFRLGEMQRGHTLADAVNGFFRRKPTESPKKEAERRTLWALKDVSFTVRQGEVLGIIGRNGAGKSTLLKILSRIVSPTAGRAVIEGRVGALLEVGTGFSSELTGRENILLSGTILGMSSQEIRSKMDEIIDFSGIERFIDTPVKRYSSGMYTRLAFAVAAHLEPEILIVDEVLAVGDLEFQRKCLGKMNAMTKGGRTVLFVSHNMGAVSELCTHAMLMQKGQVHAIGETVDVVAEYVRLYQGSDAGVSFEENPALPCNIIGASVADTAGNIVNTVDLADDVILNVNYKVTEPLDGVQISVVISRNMNEVFCTFDTDALDAIPSRGPGIYSARCRLPGMFLKAGNYTARIGAGTPDRLFVEIESALSFTVEELSLNTHYRGYRKERIGHVISPGHWTVMRVDDVS